MLFVGQKQCEILIITLIVTLSDRFTYICYIVLLVENHAKYLFTNCMFVSFLYLKLIASLLNSSLIIIITEIIA